MVKHSFIFANVYSGTEMAFSRPHEKSEVARIVTTAMWDKNNLDDDCRFTGRSPFTAL